MTDPKLLSAKLAAARRAIQTVVSGFTYYGAHISPFVTEDEYQQLAIAVVNAIDDVDENAAQAKGKKP